MEKKENPSSIGDHASKGGIARAKSLTSEERSLIASNAVRSRWNNPIPKATHEGILTIGTIEIPCAVLENGTRLLTQEGFLRALGRAGKAKGGQGASIVDAAPAFLSAKNLKPFISNDLEESTRPVIFKVTSGVKAFGYRAELLPRVCEVFLDAKAANALSHTQEHIADQALMLIRGLAQVGIIALVDEATGFQYDRPRRELEEYLKKFLSDSLRRWVRTFPADYFKHLCRLRGVELRPDMKLPQYFGHLTNNLVYRRLAPGLLRRLQERRLDRGKASDKLHSWLSADVGFPEILIHLGTVVGLMKLHTKYEDFEKQLDRIAPVYPESPGLFDDPKDWE